VPDRLTDDRQLWECPRCGAKLVGRNMAHACGPHTVEGFLDGKGPAALALWQRLVDAVQRCGPFTYAPAKTRVAFMVRVRFLAVTALSERGMTFHLWLLEPVEAPRVFRIDDINPSAHIHWIRVTRLDQLDALQQLICASYDVGTGRRAT
jgi:Domain of unknown function (DUF5655)